LSIKVGIISENENDTDAFKILLYKINYSDIEFFHMNKGFKGSSVETEDALKNILFEFEQEKPCLVLVLRDYDSKSKGKRYANWFRSINNHLNNKGIFIQIIYEIESLILADISAFNKAFKTKLAQLRKPLKVRDPKGYLKNSTSGRRDRYSESDAPEVFKEIDHNKLIQIHYINNFLKEFNYRISIDCFAHNANVT